MSDLGLLLRKAREQHGYTLDDIQEMTKIRKRYLEAIEQGEYKVLPGSFYVRAFVKTYAETVGLDAEEVLRLYHKELPRPPAPETTVPEQMIKPKSRSVQHNDRWGKVAVTALMWLFPILIIAVVYVYLSQHSGSKAENSDQDTSITTESASPSSSPSGSPSFSATPTPTPTPTPPAVALNLTKQTSSTSYYDVSPAGTHQLKIVTSGGWVGVQERNKNGKYLLNSSIAMPEGKTFDFNGPIYLNVAQPNKITITIDDQPVDDGDGTSPRKFLFTPTDATGSPTP